MKLNLIAIIIVIIGLYLYKNQELFTGIDPSNIFSLYKPVEKNIYNVDTDKEIAQDNIIYNNLIPEYTDASSFINTAQVDPLLTEHNFLSATYHMNINGVAQNNKLQNQDIRALPPVSRL